MGANIEFSRGGFLERVIKVTVTPIIVTAPKTGEFVGWLWPNFDLVLRMADYELINPPHS